MPAGPESGWRDRSHHGGEAGPDHRVVRGYAAYAPFAFITKWSQSASSFQPVRQPARAAVTDTVDWGLNRGHLFVPVLDARCPFGSRRGLASWLRGATFSPRPHVAEGGGTRPPLSLCKRTLILLGQAPLYDSINLILSL